MYIIDFKEKIKDSHMKKVIIVFFSDTFMEAVDEYYDKLVLGLSNNNKKKLKPLLASSTKSKKQVIEILTFYLNFDKSGEFNLLLNQKVKEYFDGFIIDEIFSDDMETRKSGITNMVWRDITNTIGMNGHVWLTLLDVHDEELSVMFENMGSQIQKSQSAMEKEILQGKDEKNKASAEIEKLKRKIEKVENKKNEFATKLSNINSEKAKNKQDNNSYQKLIDDNRLLEDKCASLVNKYNDVISQLTVISKENEELRSKNAIVETPKEVAEAVEEKDDEVEIIYSEDNLKNAVEGNVFIGKFDLSTLKPNEGGSWRIRIVPNDSMLQDTKLSNYESFISMSCFLNHQVSFLTYLSVEFIESKLDITDFEMLGDEEKKYELSMALKDKEVVFTPLFKKNDKVLISRGTIKYIIRAKENAFSKTILVPTTDYDNFDVFKTIIRDKNQFRVTEYSPCLHDKLKYIICNNILIRIDAKPIIDSNNDVWWISKDGMATIITKDFKTSCPERNYVSYDVDKKISYYHVQEEAIKKLEDQAAHGLSPKNDLNVCAISESDFIESVNQQAINANLHYTKKDILNFHIAVKTSQLVILAGSSGTGKTQLPFIYTRAMEMSEEKGDVLFVPISPAYTEPSDILGYFKPNIKKDSDDGYDGGFIESQTGLARFLCNAAKNRNKLYVVIFDEMNLSQIEYWFSPFMSILERKAGERRLTLYSETVSCSNRDTIPPTIEIGDNVIFIGTINLDETTKDISDRLADRAIIINLDKKEFKEYYDVSETNSKINEPELSSFDSSIFMSLKKNSENYINSFTSNEIEFFDELNKKIHVINSQKEVSYRTLKTISNYLKNSEGLSENKEEFRKEAFDLILKETIITKINGSDNSVEKLLSNEGIISVLDKHPEISDFKETRQAIAMKLNEFNNYGYTR